MNYLNSLFACIIVCQSSLFAQTDSTKKGFKPYALIDAPPFAVKKDDFKPPINIMIRSVDATTNLLVDGKIDYYIFGDSILTSKTGKVVAFPSHGNEKIVIVSNSSGYLWQTHIFKTPLADTSYFLKFDKIRKGAEILVHNIDFILDNDKSESLFYYDLLGLKGFLKLNPGVKIEISGCPKEKGKFFSDLIKTAGNKRIHFKNSANQKPVTIEPVTIKILHT